MAVFSLYLVSEGQSNCIDGRGIKWRLACYSTYSIRTEKFSHSLSSAFRNNFCDAALDFTLSEASYDALLRPQRGCVLNQRPRFVKHERIAAIQNGERGVQLPHHVFAGGRNLFCIWNRCRRIRQFSRVVNAHARAAGDALRPAAGETRCKQMQFVPKCHGSLYSMQPPFEAQFIDTLLAARETFAQASKRCIDAKPG